MSGGPSLLLEEAAGSGRSAASFLPPLPPLLRSPEERPGADWPRRTPDPILARSSSGACAPPPLSMRAHALRGPSRTPRQTATKAAASSFPSLSPCVAGDGLSAPCGPVTVGLHGRLVLECQLRSGRGFTTWWRITPAHVPGTSSGETWSLVDEHGRNTGSEVRRRGASLLATPAARVSDRRSKRCNRSPLSQLPLSS